MPSRRTSTPLNRLPWRISISSVLDGYEQVSPGEVLVSPRTGQTDTTWLSAGTPRSRTLTEASGESKSTRNPRSLSSLFHSVTLLAMKVVFVVPTGSGDGLGDSALGEAGSAALGDGAAGDSTEGDVLAEAVASVPVSAFEHAVAVMTRASTMRTSRLEVMTES